MRKRNETELDSHFPVRLETETPEAMIKLDVSEDDLRFDGTSAAVYHPTFAGEQFPCALPEGVGPVVDLYGSTVNGRAVAQSPEWASFAVGGTVNGHVRPVAKI